MQFPARATSFALAMGCAVAFFAAPADAQMRITEWMYQGLSPAGGEFVEFTNIGTEAIDMAGWSFDDDHQVPGAFDLSGFGIVQPGESVILTEDPAEAFRAAWGLGPAVKIIGDLGDPIGNNLGRNDEINLYDAQGNVVDTLTYGDQVFPGSIRTRWITGNPVSLEALGANNVYLWTLSNAGDLYGSWESTYGEVGNPGVFTLLAGGEDIPVRINEVVASNSTGLQDEDGDTPDWIELYNMGEEPVALLGHGLSDNANSPFKWVLPDVTIAPGEFLVIFASGKNRTDLGAPLHTNFAIAASGEEILFSHPSGQLIDELPPTAIPTDLSFGRQPDGTGNWFYFNEPTPGGPNVTEGHLISGPVVVSHPGGFYTGAFELTLTAAPGATIYYTLDGSIPSENSLVYEGPISVASRAGEANYFSHLQASPDEGWDLPAGEVFKATVVRSMAVEPGAIPSDVVTHTYFVDEDIVGRYTLPVISLTTDEENFWGYVLGIYVPGWIYDNEANPEDSWWSKAANYHKRGFAWERPAHLEFFEPDGQLGFSQVVGTRIHGGSTRSRRCKSLRMYARSMYGQSSIDYPVFGADGRSSFKRLILRNSGNDGFPTPHNPLLDRVTLIRDALMQSLVVGLGIDTQDYRPAIVFINGEYWGIHNIRERYDRHYLAAVHGVDPDNIDLLTRNQSVKEGDKVHYSAMLDFMAANDLSIDENYEYIKTQMDVDNYITYVAAQVYFRNTDWPQNNIDYWRPKTPDGRWQWLVFDTDFGFGWIGAANSYMHDSLKRIGEEVHWSTFLFQNLLLSEEFRHNFINRYADMLNTRFFPEHVIARIEEMAAVIEPEIPDRIHRWGAPFTMAGWNQNVQVLKTFATNRPSFCRMHVESFFDLPGQATLTFTNPTPERGDVFVNTVDLEEEGYPWSGVYFQSIPLPLHAVPNEGYHFIGWEGIEESEGQETFLYTPTGNATLVPIFGPDPKEPGPVFGDLNGDGVVNIFDLLIVLADWGPCDDPTPETCPADLNEDGQVNIFDLLLVLANWG